MACLPYGVLVDKACNVLLWLPRYGKRTCAAPTRWEELENRLRILDDRIKENRQAAHISYLPSEDDRRSLDKKFDKLEDRVELLHKTNGKKRKKIHGIWFTRWCFYFAENDAMEEISEIVNDLKAVGESTETYNPDNVSY